MRGFGSLKGMLRWPGGGLEVPARFAIAVQDDTIRAATLFMPYCLLTSASVALVLLSTAGSVGLASYRLGLLAAIEILAVVGAACCWLVRRQLVAGLAPWQRRLATLGGAGLSLLLGIAWGSMPVMLFAPAGPVLRVMVACTCAGLIATGLTLFPLRNAYNAFALPIIVGSFVALQQTGVVPFMGLSVLLAIYTVFILSACAQMRRLFLRYTLGRLQQDDQSSTIQLLLGQADTDAHSWLWETDSQGCLCLVSDGMAQALGRTQGDLDGHYFLRVIAAAETHHGDETADRSGYEKLLRCLNTRLAFRSLLTEVRGLDGPRWWSISGRPRFDDHAQFLGFKGVASDLTDQHTAQVKAFHQARHDALTGLPNRYSFSDALRAAIKRLGRRSEPFALLSLDFDEFKLVNDRLGHAVGDLLLKAASKRLRNCLGARDVLARFGGDEFVILMPDATTSDAGALAARLLEQFQTPFTLSAESIRVGISIGVSMAPAAGDSAEYLLEAADLALYQAKHAGGNVCRFFDPELRERAQAQRLLLKDLRDSVSRKALDIVFQPIVDAQTLALRGFEALARWRRPGHGAVPADRFIKAAEEGGLIDELGAWVLEEACKEAVTWPDHLKLAVNVSVSQLSTEMFAGQVERILSRTGLPASRLELEVTESIFMDAEASSFGVLEALQAMGAGVALDDFGKGFSSLGFLKGFMFTKIKIDRAFVSDMAYDRASAAVVKAVVGLAADLGIIATAEGVETWEQLRQLRQLGCTEAQGYLFSRPIGKVSIPGLLAHLHTEFNDDKSGSNYVFRQSEIAPEFADMRSTDATPADPDDHLSS